MMELFIQIQNGQPYEHPIIGDNFREAFPHIDVDNLPPEFARFVRTPAPIPDGPYRLVIAGSYVWDNGAVKDNWLIVDMSAEEKAEKIALAMRWRPEGDQWVFDEAAYMWVDPTAVNAATTIEVSRV
jgi:hypothetical protein